MIVFYYHEPPPPLRARLIASTRHWLRRVLLFIRGEKPIDPAALVN